tara:strand:+ start:3759 stop:4109 length:351 start_codon:yes stop_codon:yes gene_type:complete
MKNLDIFLETFRSCRNRNSLIEGALPFYIYRTDTNAVLARGIVGYESTREKANELRKKLNLKWDQVKFKADRTRKTPHRYPASSGGRIEYSDRYNPSKRGRFRGGYDSQGNYYDID